MDTIEFNVKDAAGAYTTNTVRGQRASSTASAAAAAQRLAEKVFQDGQLRVRKLHDISSSLSRWCASSE